MSKTATSTLRARAYIRVSHVGKGRKDTLVSDQAQLQEAIRYCQFAGLALDEKASKDCADLDVSGFRKPWRQRPGLAALYESAKRREFDCVVFFKISRLARNVREALDMIDAFEKEGVAFHFVAERIDSTSAQGRFLRNVLLAAAEMQSEDISAFLKASCEQRARSGRLHGGAVPMWIKDREHRDEVIPEQVAAIRRMIDLRIKGTGYVKIAKALNEEGFRTTKGGYWTHGTTFKYLQPSYIQTMRGSAFYGRGGSESIEIPNAYPAIITAEEAEQLLAVQRLYSEDYGRKPVQGLDWMVSRRRKNGRYSASTVHLLSSIIFCPACGARMVASMRAEKEHNRSTPFKYGCPHYITRSDLHIKGLNSVNALALEDAVLRVLRAVLVLPPPSERPIQPETKRDGVAAIQKKIDRLLELHLDGRIDEEDFKRAYGGLVAEKDTALEADRPELLSEQHRQAMELIGKDELTREELRQLVLLMVERVDAPITIPGVVIVQSHKSLRRLARITLRFPTAEGDREFLSPIYNPEYGGIRKFIPVREDVDDRVLTLIGEKVRERRDDQTSGR